MPELARGVGDRCLALLNPEWSCRGALGAPNCSMYTAEYSRLNRWAPAVSPGITVGPAIGE
eukprot:4771685-Prymnesium_polylepis.1